MTKMFLSTSMIFISFFLFFLNHPLSMGIFILIQTLLMCLLTGLMMNTYWFSYILFLIFSGGLLILFIYVSSIASNELFLINIKNKINIMMIIFCILLLSLLFNKNLLWLNMMLNKEMNNMLNILIFINYENNNINLSKLYNNHNYLITMMMIIYLFITLIAVVKITNLFFGPLRSIN
uniref:NADH-ubiquinone oxidoreductase chain 6 n=1 Tax=Cigaritis takanonis TaxID=2714157 RepID=G3CUS2_CIGTA|nr:NADH dehydrogenase subunit 6 [Cigaritis takanonis]ADN43216.1 NADH dehydrogenase subunit 6 [Cigaritis takanonis]